MNQRIHTNWRSCFQSRSRKTRCSRTSSSVFIFKFSSRTAWTASASCLLPSASSRIVRLIFGQFFPPSNGVPLSIDIASLGSNRCRSRVFLSERAGKARRYHGVGRDREPLADLDDVLAIDRVSDRLTHL